MASVSESLCVLCNKSKVDEVCSVIRQKGAATLNKAILDRKDNRTSVKEGDCVHESCRKNYVSSEKIAKLLDLEDQKWSIRVKNARPTRGSSTFTFNDHCFLCGSLVNRLVSHKPGFDFALVLTADFEQSIKQYCEERRDDWALEVLGRISSVSDLRAADAIYHKQCSSNFRTKNDIPDKFANKSGIKKRKKYGGSSVDDDRREAFKSVMVLIEDCEEDNPVTLSDLCLKMGEQGVEPYSEKWMKTQVMSHFGNKVFFTRLDAKTEFVSLYVNTSDILKDFYKSNTNTEKETKSEEVKKTEIIEAAAKLLKTDILNMTKNTEEFELFESLSSEEKVLNFIPASLRTFLSLLFVGTTKNKKIASIGQAIAQATRPRAITAPLQLGLAVQLHHLFSSRTLIDLLFSLGFCSAYHHVILFEKNSALVNKTELHGLDQGAFVHHIADNADHNTRTLDGKNTFHGMGIIATITPSPKAITRMTIPRKQVSANDLKEAGQIRIIQYTRKASALSNIIYSMEIDPVESRDPSADVNLLWLSSWFFKTPPASRPGWNGTMQMVTTGNQHLGKASIVFLPFIDLPASDETCIYSTLSFVAMQGKKYGFTPVLTFDQPLYWKSLMIVKSENSDSDISRIVLRLGGFHLMMSYIGAIGHIMDGSGKKINKNVSDF